MNNKKISTSVGTIVILIVAITVGAFVWKIEKNKPKVGMSNIEQQPKDNQNQETTNDSEWKTYKNDKYKFEIQYPSDYLFDENLTDGPVYSINFGPSYEKTFGKNHPNYKTVINFGISIDKNESGINNFIKKENAVRTAVEQTSESTGTEKVADLSAKIIKACDIGGYCNKIVYFTQDKYIYSIFMRNYFTVKDEISKKNFDRMLTSFKFGLK